MSSKTSVCGFNSHVNCPKSGRDCENCGWNPEVQEERLAANPKPALMKYISLDDALAVARYSKDPVAGLKSLPFILHK